MAKETCATLEHVIPTLKCAIDSLSCTESLGEALQHAEKLCKGVEEPLHAELENDLQVVREIEEIIADYEKLLQSMEDCKLEEERLTDHYNNEAERIKADVTVKMSMEFINERLRRQDEMIQVLEAREKLLGSEISYLSTPLNLTPSKQDDTSKLQTYCDALTWLSGLELDVAENEKVVVSLPVTGEENTTPHKVVNHPRARKLVFTPSDDLSTNLLKTNLTLLQELDQLRESFAVDWLADERCLTLLPCQNSSAMLVKLNVPTDYPHDPPSVHELRAIDDHLQSKIIENTKNMKTVTEMVRYITALLTPAESWACTA